MAWLRVDDLAVAFHDAAHQVRLFAAAFDHRLYALELFGRHHQHHADAHIKGAHHVVLGNVAYLLHVAEHRQYWPRSHLHHRCHAFGQYAWKIVRDAAADDVCHGVDHVDGYQLFQDRPAPLVLAHEFCA